MPESTARSWWPLFWLLLALVVLWALAWIGGVVRIDDWEKRGQFGDMFGAVNSLFSGLAFAGVIFTIHLQRQELALQREELRLTRDELSRSADAQEESGSAMAQQARALENTATLNGLSSLIEHYSFTIQSADGATQRERLARKRLGYVARLEALITTIDTEQETEAQETD